MKFIIEVVTDTKAPELPEEAPGTLRFDEPTLDDGHYMLDVSGIPDDPDLSHVMDFVSVAFSEKTGVWGAPDQIITYRCAGAADEAMSEMFNNLGEAEYLVPQGPDTDRWPEQSPSANL